MFATAPIAAGPVSKKAKDKTETIPTKGIHLLAALQVLKKNVEGQIATVEADVKDIMLSTFTEKAFVGKKKPESYTGTDNGSSASLQCKARASSSALTDAELEILADYKIPVETLVTREETFIINPAYADLSDAENKAMLDKVEQALAGLGLPADFIQRQLGISKKIVSDETIAAVCSMAKKSDVASLLPMVTSLAIRATFAEDANAFEVVEKAMAVRNEAEAAA
jgi:hypothetical protein